MGLYNLLLNKTLSSSLLSTLASLPLGLVWVWGWGRGNMSMTLKSYVGMGEAMGRKDTQDPAQESETTA